MRQIAEGDDDTILEGICKGTKAGAQNYAQHRLLPAMCAN
jgi:hypothetical protein